MAYEVIMRYHLHMPSYFLGIFAEYLYCKSNDTFFNSFNFQSY